jgi:3-oxoacyl-[acyl-carrier-protein] synthase-3
MSKSFAKITAIAKYLPIGTLTNEELSSEFPDWSVEKIAEKTGIHTRHIAHEEFSSDLAIKAVRELVSITNLDISSVDFLIVVTQTPDYILPGIASIVHNAVGLARDSGAIDVNLGCSGYVYALGVAKGLIETGQARKVIVSTSDTYSKLLNNADKSVRTIFGDGATATLIENDAETESIQGLTYGTDGTGAGNLIVPKGGIRNGEEKFPRTSEAIRGIDEGRFNLFMDGPEIFNFTIAIAQSSMIATLKKTKLQKEEIDLFVFHQANAFMLEHLRKKLDIPEEKFPVLMGNWGNTVSGTIPMALSELIRDGKVKAGSKVLCMGFGVGLSWAATVITL